MSERVFDHVHEVLDSDEHIGLFKTRTFSDFVNDVCFSHCCT